ncbi:hypothetical protein C9374_008994 [Naegleria lovaniensis]|uniref:Uncharacterized protein n=1 Tax=Naegleria lovaniensis TaxID=51637 RepID=A0AA88GEM8_NAELO|nr:uncharacterized protein C9374_013695 [Naegleria lovaniensis]XP_044545171.1 uncharacterized protein C9374_008994 [Naegleria lovaniensis]KAG2372631.1 hypothetical protein C9374_013695 [Naegleria lovaniensis]KAG2377909.1 hypothetical protein C9374_008994 [Naegleria lovaniensis]
MSSNITTFTNVNHSDGLIEIILGKSVETIIVNNDFYYRFQDLKHKYESYSKYSKNNDVVKIGRKGLTYVCLEIALDIITKEDNYRSHLINYLTQQQLQRFQNNSETMQQTSQTSTSFSNISQDIPNAPSTSSPTKRKQTLQELDKQNKTNATPSLSIAKPKVLTKRSRNTEHDIKEITKKKKESKRIREQEIDTYLNRLIEQYDKEKKDIVKSNISKVNLVAASETRDIYKSQNTEAILSLAQAISSSNHVSDNEKETFRKLKQMSLKPVSLTKQLKVKDELCCSNKAWKEHIFSLGLNDILKADLKDIEGQVTNALVEYFGIQHVLKGFVMKLEPVIIAAVKSHLHTVFLRKQQQRPVNEELPDSLVIKMSMDGRKFDGLQTVVVTLSVLNLTTFGTQERRNVFPVAMYIGNEQEIMDYCKNFAQQVEKISKDGIQITKKQADASLNKENFNMKVTIIWVSDLKSLSYVSDLLEGNMFCLRCACLKCNSLNGTSMPRFLNHKFGIDSSKIYICILHAEERITEHLVKWSLTKEEYEKLVLERVRKLPCFSSSFTFHSTQVKNTSDAEEDPVLENEDYKFMLTGGMVEVISQHYKTIFENVVTDEMMEIWDQWIIVRQWLKMTNDERAKKTEEELLEFYQLLTKWHINIVELRSSVGVLPYYIHIIVHHVKEFFDEIGSLVPVSNEAVEGSHQHDHFITERATAKGKKKYFFDEYVKDSNTVWNEMSIYTEPDLSIDEFNNIFKYEKHIPRKEDKREWNQLFQIFQLIVKKLRVLFLSFRSDEDTTFERIEERSGDKVKERWNSFNDLKIKDRVIIESDQSTATNLQSSRSELEKSKLDLYLQTNVQQEEMFQDEMSDFEDDDGDEEMTNNEQLFDELSDYEDGDEEMEFGEETSIPDDIVDFIF